MRSPCTTSMALKILERPRSSFSRAAPVIRILPCSARAMLASAFGSRDSRKGKADSGQIRCVMSAMPVCVGAVARSESSR